MHSTTFIFVAELYARLQKDLLCMYCEIIFNIGPSNRRTKRLGIKINLDETYKCFLYANFYAKQSIKDGIT